MVKGGKGVKVGIRVVVQGKDWGKGMVRVGGNRPCEVVVMGRQVLVLGKDVLFQH